MKNKTILKHYAEGLAEVATAGNAFRRETCPDGSKDENVFDIRQGVAICFMVRSAE